jgi:hypothetical protein
VKAESSMTQVLEKLFDAAWRYTALSNRKIVDIAHSHLDFGFELARAKTFSDVLKLQAAYWQKLFNAFQGEEFSNCLSEPGEPVIQGESAKGERNRPQVKPENASSPVAGTATEKPKQRRERPKRRATTRASRDKKKERSRSKLKNHRLPSREAHTDAGKRRAGRDRVSKGPRTEIQYGMLDDNAVCFTSLEAWQLLDNTWSPIPVDEVLSDAVELSKARFDEIFPQVPKLPTDAFSPEHDQD